MIDADTEGEISVLDNGSYNAIDALYSNLTYKSHGNKTDVHSILIDNDESDAVLEALLNPVIDDDLVDDEDDF